MLMLLTIKNKCKSTTWGGSHSILFRHKSFSPSHMNSWPVSTSIERAEVEHGKAFAQIIRNMGLKGESAYATDGETIVDLPTQAISGRVGMHGKTFSGVINLETGEMRIDCAEEPSFWMHVNLSRVPAFALAPGGPGVSSVQEHFEGLNAYQVLESASRNSIINHCV